MHKFKIPIGDWSSDGHGKCVEFIIECNKTADAVRQAYKESCKLTTISFNHNEDYTETNRSWAEACKFQIAVEYENNTISKEAEELLLEHGIDVWEGFDMKYHNKEKDNVYIDGPEHFIELLMKFIKLSLTDLQYKIVKDDIPYLNGYWNKDLNVQFGYGLFN